MRLSASYMYCIHRALMSKELVTFRFTPSTRKRLRSFANRKRTTMTQVIESMGADYCKTRTEEKRERT